jgi:tetratricopeptide (TPR) repeat protein
MRGTAWQENGELDLALRDYSKAIQLDSKNAAYWSNRGIVYRIKQEFTKAIADFDEAIRLSPKNYVVYTNRGNVYGSKQDYTKAIADFDEAIRLNPTYARAYSNRGNAHVGKQDYDKAIPDFDEAIRLAPNEAGYWHNRGVAYQGKQDNTKALTDFDQAIQLDPKLGSAFIAKAWILATCPDAKYRNGEQAVVCAKRACELSDWKMPFWLAVLAATYAEVGDFDQAIKWQKKALEFPAFERKFGRSGRDQLKLYEQHKPYREVRK